MIRAMIFFCIVIFTASIHAAPGQSIPLNQHETEAAKRSGSKGLGVTELWNGYRLECRMQDLQAEVTMSGATIISTSKSEGKGAFTIRATRIGRAELMQNLSTVADWISMKDKVIIIGRGNVVEEYAESGVGIRQDFTIIEKPQGEEKLLLELSVDGTMVKKPNHGIELRLPSGRVLVYHSLNVNDVTGKTLAAAFETAKNNNIAIAIDDRSASYPLHIDPTISDDDWSALGSGMGNQVHAVALDPAGNLYAGGLFTSAGALPANRIAKWDGSAWSALGSGMNNSVEALAFDSSGNLYAGGLFTSAGDVAATAFIAKWDGSAWSALGSGMDGDVLTLTIDSSGNVYAGGRFSTAGGVAVLGVARWDGSAWHAFGSGTGFPVLTLVFDRLGNFYAGGGDVILNGPGGIAKWEISRWVPLGGGTSNHSIAAIKVDLKGNLYAGGLFDTLGGTAASRIAKWDGSTWSPLGSGTNEWVLALAIDRADNLYAGGRFSTAGGVSARYIARWNGSTWSPLGSGVNGNVLVLAVDQEENLCVGGSFIYAGGKTVRYIATCGLAGTTVMPSECDNPYRFPVYNARTSRILFHLQSSTDVHYRVYTLAGREVFRASELFNRGDQSLRINKENLAQGTYIGQMKAGNESIRFRITVER